MPQEIRYLGANCEAPSKHAAFETRMQRIQLKLLKKNDMQKSPLFQGGNNRLANQKQILHFERNQSFLK